MSGFAIGLVFRFVSASRLVRIWVRVGPFCVWFVYFVFGFVSGSRLSSCLGSVGSCLRSYDSFFGSCLDRF